MIYYEEFEKTCPACGAKDKIIKPCKECFNDCCSICSLDRVCINCLTENEWKDVKVRYAKENFILVD